VAGHVKGFLPHVADAVEENFAPERRASQNKRLSPFPCPNFNRKEHREHKDFNPNSPKTKTDLEQERTELAEKAAAMVVGKAKF
jgi:hypothetical protein